MENSIQKQIKPMYAYQIANLYGVDVRTLKNWLIRHKQNIDKIEGTRLYTIAEIEKIFFILGDPREN